MMKKLLFIPIALMALPCPVSAAQLATLTSCIRDCIQAFNPSLADSGADEFVISDFEHKECVDWCREETYYGECGFWTDGCCHTDYPDYDPDCGELPAGNNCTDDLQCASDICDFAEGETVGTCLDEPEVETVESAGQMWMDRNLGASRVATSFDDAEAYGDLYQWGRGPDGHQIRTSPTTTTLSSSDDPGHGDFIITSSNPLDWRVPQNDNLWQGESGINNPCPAGFRLPTDTELDTERMSWTSNDRDGAFDSPLKLVAAGFRYDRDGTVYSAGNGYYWSSTIDDYKAHCLVTYSDGANMGKYVRASGFSARCIED